MKGLLLKDLYSLKGYMRQYVILLLFFMLFGVTMGNSHYIMWMSMVLGLNIGFAAFPFDEAGGYAYMLAAPVGRRTMVQARYLVAVAGGAVILSCSAVGEIVNRMASGGATEQWLTEMSCVLGIYLIFISVLIPVSYRFSVEKARLVMLGMVAVPMAVVFLSMKLIQIAAVAKFMEGFFWIFSRGLLAHYGAFFFLGAGLLALAGSYLLSVKIFDKLEF